VHSRGELTLAPDEYAGFIMACLRMLALNGDAGPQTALEAPVAPARQTAEPAAAIAAPAADAVGAAVTAAAAPSGASQPTASAPDAGAVAPPVSGASVNHAETVNASGGNAADDSASRNEAPASASESASAAASASVDAPSESPAAVAAAPAQPAAAALPQSPAASVPQSADSSSVPPWEDLPPDATNADAGAATSNAPTSNTAARAVTAADASTPDPSTADTSPPDAAAPHAPSAKPQGSAALAVTPAAAAIAPASASAPAMGDTDGPPSWVDEEIPFEAEGGFMPDSGFTSDPDDDFETLATSPAPAPAPPAARRDGPAPARKRQSRAPRLTDMDSASWPELAARLPVTGLASELARQSEWAGVQGDAIILRVAVKTLAESESRVRLQTVLCEHFGQGIRLDVQVGVTGDATAYAVAQAESAARQLAAENAVADDPFVQALLSDFGGHVVAGSIRHVDSAAAA